MAATKVARSTARKAAPKTQAERNNPRRLPAWLVPVAIAGKALTPGAREALARIAVDLAAHKYDPPPPPAPLTVEQERDILAKRITAAHEAIDEVAVWEAIETFQAVEALAHEAYDNERLARSILVALRDMASAGGARLLRVGEAIDTLNLYRGAEVKPKDLAELEEKAEQEETA